MRFTNHNLTLLWCYVASFRVRDCSGLRTLRFCGSHIRQTENSYQQRNQSSRRNQRVRPIFHRVVNGRGKLSPQRSPLSVVSVPTPKWPDTAVGLAEYPVSSLEEINNLRRRADLPFGQIVPATGRFRGVKNGDHNKFFSLVVSKRSIGRQSSTQ
jgi:hypothetical protein